MLAQFWEVKRNVCRGSPNVPHTSFGNNLTWIHVFEFVIVGHILCTDKSKPGWSADHECLHISTLLQRKAKTSYPVERIVSSCRRNWLFCCVQETCVQRYPTTSCIGLVSIVPTVKIPRQVFLQLGKNKRYQTHNRTNYRSVKHTMGQIAEGVEINFGELLWYQISLTWYLFFTQFNKLSALDISKKHTIPQAQ